MIKKKALWNKFWQTKLTNVFPIQIGLIVRFCRIIGQSNYCTWFCPLKFPLNVLAAWTKASNCQEFVRRDESGRPVGRSKCHGIHTQALHAEGIISLPSQTRCYCGEEWRDRGVRPLWMKRKKTREEKEEMDCNNERLESEWRRNYANFWTKDVTKYAMTIIWWSLIIAPFDVQLFIGYKLIGLYVQSVGSRLDMFVHPIRNRASCSGSGTCDLVPISNVDNWMRRLYGVGRRLKRCLSR